MPQIVSRALVLGGIVLCAFGCSSRFQRSKYDPFVSAKQQGKLQQSSKTDNASNEYPQLVSPGNGEEVTQASREFHSKRPISDRPQRTQVSSDWPRETADRSTWDSFGPETSARPAAGKTLDHAPDYSWVQGKLEYTSLSGGIWRVRYAPLSADDAHGGCVILQSPPNAQQFQVGDIVYVEGHIIEPNTRGPLPNPTYRVDLMNRVGE